jgi:hypothetical protein
MRKLLETEYLVKELKECYGCGQLKMLHYISIWLTIDEVLLKYSVINLERVTILEHCTTSHCASPFYEVAMSSKY